MITGKTASEGERVSPLRSVLTGFVSPLKLLKDNEFPKPEESINPHSNPNWDCEIEMEQFNSKKNVKHTSKVLKFFIFHYSFRFL